MALVRMIKGRDVAVVDESLVVFMENHGYQRQVPVAPVELVAEAAPESVETPQAQPLVPDAAPQSTTEAAPEPTPEDDPA